MAASSAPHCLYQCSECEHCTDSIEDFTIHAVEVHNIEIDQLEDEDDGEEFLKVAHSSFEADSTNALPTNNCSPENRGTGVTKRTDMWQKEHVQQLIECVKQNTPELRNKFLRKKMIWDRIRDVMVEQMPEITSKQCEQKWRNLLSQYRKYKAIPKETKSRVRKPDFLEEITSLVDGEVQDREHVTSDTVYEDLPGRKVDSDHVSMLNKILDALERKEASKIAFQKQFIEIEQSKLQTLKQFVENRQKENETKVNLLRQWLSSQEPATKRKRTEY